MSIETRDFQPGPCNGLSDIAGLAQGHAHDEAVRTGVSLIVGDAPMVAAVDVRGGAPGTRETDLLGPSATVERIDAVVLSGGSAFGLEAASAVQAELAAQGRGFAVGNARVPLVPQAILFDLLNGGQDLDPASGLYAALGRAAVTNLGKRPGVAEVQGAVGAGFGATTGSGPGGLGSASLRHRDGWSLAALVAVNAVGAPLRDRARGQLWADPWLMAGDLPNRPTTEPASDSPRQAPSPRKAPLAMSLKGHDLGANTSIGVIATDLPLTQKQLRRVVAMAHNGLARALRPSHTPLDGDTLFALSTGTCGQALEEAALYDLAIIGELLADCVTRAVARGVVAGSAYWQGGA